MVYHLLKTLRVESKSATRRARYSLIIAGLTLILPFTHAETKFGQFGPYDYYDPPKGALSLVERAHFGAKTEQLARRKSWCGYWSDLDYTLRALPNHPRALVAMSEYLKDHQPCKKRKSRRNRQSSVYDIVEDIDVSAWQKNNADYYYKRAIEFRPKYSSTYVLYGRFLHKNGELDKSLQYYKEAEKRDPDSIDVHYYLGLLYFDKGYYDKAKTHADESYKHGQTLTELRDKLIQAGHWIIK